MNKEIQSYTCWYDDQIGLLKNHTDSLNHFLPWELITSKNSPLKDKENSKMTGRRDIFDNRFEAHNQDEGEPFAMELMKFDDNRIIICTSWPDFSVNSHPVKLFEQTKSAILYIDKQLLLSADAGEVDVEKLMLAFFTLEYEQLQKLTEFDRIGIKNESLQEDVEGYFRLSARERAKVQKKFRSQVEDQVKDYFNNGAIWILYLGSNSEPYILAYSEDQIRDYGYVNQLAIKKRKIPHIFESAPRIDSVERSAQYDAPKKTYPFARFQIPTSLSGVIFESFHFDTGSDICILSGDFVAKHDVEYEYVASKEYFFREDYLVSVTIGKFEWLQQPSNSESANAIEFFAHVWDEWASISNPLFIACEKDKDICGCVNTVCSKRKNGLIGRPSYIRQHINYEIQINTSTHEVSFTDLNKAKE